MAIEHNRPQGLDPERLARAVIGLMPDWNRRELGEFTYLSGGYSNENYRFDFAGEQFVLRLPSRQRPFVDRQQEAVFYQRSAHVRTAELIALDPLTGNMLSRFEDGTLLSEASVSAPELVTYLESLHGALPASGRAYNPVALGREYLAAGPAPPWIEQLAGDLHWQPQTLSPCHNDLNPWNVIVPPNSGPWVTIDWEWFGDNDPLFDLVTLHQGLALAPETLTAMAERWSGGPVVPRRLTHCLKAYWLREYAWAHAELLHGNDRQEIRTQLATAFARLETLQTMASG